MRVAVLYRKSEDSDQGFPMDSQGRRDLKHVVRIKDCLELLGHQPQLLDVNLDSYENLRHAGFDLAFNLCDDGFRNDSLLEAHVPAMLEILQIPYTGSNFFTLASCVNKARTKEILTFHHIPTPEFQVFEHTAEQLNNKLLDFPLIVKPLHEDASIGVRPDSVVNNIYDLKQRVAHVINEYRQPALAEKFIDGREVYVGILGNKEKLTVLPISEIIFESQLAANVKICSYEAKWVPETQAYQNTPVQCPAQIDQELKRKLIKIAQQAYNLMDCQDYGRIDFRIDKDNQPFVLEVNPNPDLSEDAGLATMIRACDWRYEQFIERIMNAALERVNHRTRR